MGRMMGIDTFTSIMIVLADMNEILSGRIK